MKKLELTSFGPIVRGAVEFGDLTVLVGPQASGKSLLVQLFKAITDAGSIRNDLKQYGFDWLHGGDPLADFLAIYFGGGMQSLWENGTRVIADGRPVDIHRDVVNPPGRASGTESVFLIPAQRVLVLQDGWPRPFMGYAAGDPYCLRNFSDALRKLMEGGFGGARAVFPQPRRLKAELQRLLDEAIYVSGRLALHTEGMRKRIVLVPREGKSPLPFSAWSAGQREFTPLLLGLYRLIPAAGISKQKSITTVVIEEPEMGLHPRAIVSFSLLVFELLDREYKVIVSTHSPVVLDVLWAIQELRQLPMVRATRSLMKVFGLRRLAAPMRGVLETALRKKLRTYYFHRNGVGVHIQDISSLDPGDADDQVSGWGGLTGFSGHIADVVGEALSEGIS